MHVRARRLREVRARWRRSAHRPPACTPGDLSRTVWEPYRPDGLVAFDVAATRLAFPASLTGNIPWIGILRAVRHAWPRFLETSLTNLLTYHGLDDEAAAVREANPGRPAAQMVLQMAHVMHDLLGAMEVRCSMPRFRSPRDRLRPILGRLAATPSVQALIDLSALTPKAGGRVPGPWDPSEWRRIAMDDLIGLASIDGCDWTADAHEEVGRRSAEAGCAPPSADQGRFILRRGIEHRYASGARP